MHGGELANARSVKINSVLVLNGSAEGGRVASDGQDPSVAAEGQLDGCKQ